MDRVEGGFIVKARVVQRSWISKAPPHIREIWDWILMNANYKDNGKVKRGQLLTTYGDMMEGLAWYVGYRKETYKKHHCETATKALTRQLMITTTRTTRGVIITVLNYDKYQNVKNYESDGETCYETTRDVHESGYDKETRKKEERKKEDKSIVDKSTRPTLENVISYCEERGCLVDAQRWFDYYSSNGWRIGKNPMKDWRAAVRTWEKNGFSHSAGTKETFAEIKDRKMRQAMHDFVGEP